MIKKNDIYKVTIIDQGKERRRNCEDRQYDYIYRRRYKRRKS